MSMVKVNARNLARWLDCHYYLANEKAVTDKEVVEIERERQRER